jgi:hypothetical protein
MPFYRREGHELRGDRYDFWGNSEWWFDVDDQNHAVRQIELYSTGPMKRYSTSHPEDEASGLTSEPFDVTEWLPFRVEPAAFEALWRADHRIIAADADGCEST